MDFVQAPAPPEITEVTRRGIIDALLLLDFDFHGRLDIVTFFGRIWDLKRMPSTDRRYADLDGDMRQHIPWGDPGFDDAGLLYGKLDIVHVSDDVFGRFLTETLHPVVQNDPARVAELLAIYNHYLQADGFEIVESERISGRPVYTMRKIGVPFAEQAQNYEVSLSYAGEQGEYVERVAAVLRDAGVKLFYYPYKEADLWGEDLVEAFEHVFLRASRFAVMFISKEYRAKMWPTVERRAAVERAISQTTVYILPVRFDDTPIPGLRGTVAYQDARLKSPEEIAALILRKLGK